MSRRKHQPRTSSREPYQWSNTGAGQPAPRRKPIDRAEEREIKTWLDYCRLVTFEGEPLIERVVMVPNQRGAKGPQVAILIGLGLRPGFHDYIVLAPTKGCPGFTIEAKKPGEQPSDDQVKWRDKLQRWGYESYICDSGLLMIESTRAYFAAHDLGRTFVDRVKL